MGAAVKGLHPTKEDVPHAPLTAMLAPDFSPDDVPAELAVWNRWNWLRTGLALLATAFSTVALATSADEDRPVA